MRNKIHINRKRQTAVTVAALMLMFIAWVFFPQPCYADTPEMGRILDGPVKLRKSPADGEKITLLYPGTVVKIIRDSVGVDGKLWYEVTVAIEGKTFKGYLRSDFIEPMMEETERKDTIDGVVDYTEQGVYVRSGPGTSYAFLLKVYKGQAVSIMQEQKAEGMKWYQVALVGGPNSAEGWIAADYVRKNGETAPEETEIPQEDNFVEELKKAGFPSSYRTPLAALHQKYPNWKFTAVQTGLDWNEVVANESRPGQNLVQSSVNDARKSTDAAAYNWANNTWYGYDGAGWVCASPEYIAYCIDPRNFLDENYIFQFETLNYASYQKKAGVNNILANTFMSGDYNDTDGETKNYADTFIKIGKKLAVSPYHLASRCRQEQGTKGTSPLISGKYAGYEGYFNHFNVRAYTTAFGSATENGLSYAKEQGWNSIYKSLEGGSTIVANNYVKRGQDTIYFEKFNVVYQNSLYSHQYMTNVMAAISEGSSMGKAYTDKKQAFEFRIPVYKNMPNKAVAFVDKGNPNNWLKSLKVNGYKLTPTFRGDKTEYSVVVNSDVTSVVVSAEPVVGTTTVVYKENSKLKYGDNEIPIVCTAQDGTSRTYTITVARQKAARAQEPVKAEYSVGTYATGIAPGSSAEEVLTGMDTFDGIDIQGGEVKILNADGTENTGNVGTGNRIVVYEGDTPTEQYEVVVYGDINGDGEVSNVDAVLLQKHILNITTQTGAYLEAANVSRDGEISNKDLVILQKHILKLENIAQ